MSVEQLHEELSLSLHDFIEMNTAVRAWSHHLENLIETEENFPVSQLADHVLMGIYIGEMSVAQIANTLNISLEEVESNLIETVNYLADNSKQIVGIDIDSHLLINEYLIIRARNWAKESDQFQTSQQLSETTRYSDYHIRNLAGNGALTSIHTRKGWLISPESLEEYRKLPERRGRPNKKQG